MSGDAQIAKRIASWDEDPAVKKCLLALFTHELSNADKVMPPYKSDYEKTIAKHAPAWAAQAGDEVDS